MVDMMGVIRAPEFPADLSWLNVPEPLSMRALRGKIVLLDFWTFCCINCMHIIPELKKLEERFPDTLVVIGVHSPKYYAEQVLENVRQAVLRYDVEHPVISDSNHAVWDSYAVNAWPTIALVNPEGRLVGEQPGEFEADALAPTIEQVEAEFDRRGLLNRTPIRMSLEKDRQPERTLNFPGKVVADSGRLFIADSSHHRILITDLEGNIQEVIGSGKAGLNDGSFQEASFHGPQGMAVNGSILYVADTENHSIREVDLEKRRVRLIAGTGEQARLSRRSGPAPSTALSSPWDLALDNGMLYIANAGNHQIWVLNTAAGQLDRFAGTGREALHDDTLQRCALAQTSGLSFVDGNLYFADSETSSIRVARIAEDRVETIVGEGLFDFGDIDGRGSEVRLQHCLGVAYHDGMLYAADSYNNKIKLIDPRVRSSQTFLGTGEAGLQDGPGMQARFWEPGGLWASDGRLYVADTNNHAIRVADVQTAAVSTLEITGA